MEIVGGDLPTTRSAVRRRVLVAAIAALAAAGLPLVAAAPARAATTWVVTTTADTDGACAPGACSLRAAIGAANRSAGPDLISFDIAPAGPQTIVVGAGAALGLPAIRGEDITIDGTTQPGGGATGVRLDDPDPDGGESGLTVEGPRATIRGLKLTGFDRYGIYLKATARDAVVAGNWIGTADGTTADGTTDDGIRVKGGGGHRIGGSVAADRNLVAGSGNDGIELEDTSDNVVSGNYVGMTGDGLGRLPNADSGIELNGVSLRNRVGGLTAGERNLISGNNGIGVQLLGSMRADGSCETPEANQVRGNYLGVNVNGTKPTSGGTHGNYGEGVQLSVCARNNLVGGTTPGARNVISGNRADGVELDSSGGPAGAAAVCGNIVQGNYIGSDPTGTTPVPNSDDGVGIDNRACGNQVGGTETGAGNLIGGNFNDGVDIARPGSTSNTVQGNVIGLAADGSNVLRNTQNGVHLRNRAAGNLVAGNTISGNLQSGVLVEHAGTDANTVRDNRIGTSTGGTAVRGNKRHGIWLLDGAQRTLVQGNRVEGSTLDGVAVERTAAATAATVGNHITRTTTRGNGGLGIDLLPADGPNPNDGDTTATVGNNGLDTPVITAASASSVLGTAAAGAVVEVFTAVPGSGEANGEGASYLGAATADATGRWCLPGVTVSAAVTATATAGSGDTSELAANTAPAGTANLCQPA
jgi:CSLREA domain-containing protein